MVLKTLDKLVLKAFTTPFIGSFFTMLLILLMQNVWKYIDDLIGKGLEWPIILEIVVYIIPTLVPLALPLAILLASLMAFGKLGETYETYSLKIFRNISLQNYASIIRYSLHHFNWRLFLFK